MADRPHVLALIPLPPVARESLAAHYELHLAPNGPESIGSEVPLEKIAAVATNGTTPVASTTLAPHAVIATSASNGSLSLELDNGDSVDYSGVKAVY